MDIKDTTRGYMDFAGLGKLRGQAAQNQSAALREASQQFEAAFIEMMLKSMREAGFSDLFASAGEDMYRDMMDRELSVQMARRGSLGITDMLQKQLEKRPAPLDPAAGDVLRGRDAGYLVQRRQSFPLDATWPGGRAGVEADPLRQPNAAFELR